MEKVTVGKRRKVWGAVLKYAKRWRRQRGPDLQLPRLAPPRRDTHSLDPKILSEIYRHHSSEKEKTRACSDAYVNCRPESSWEHLTSLLYEEDEMTAVDQARPFLPPRGKLNDASS
jgi:hypothetical protein